MLRKLAPGLVCGFEVDWNRIEISLTELGEDREVYIQPRAAVLVSSRLLSEV